MSPRDGAVTLTVRRQLSPQQQLRRQRIVDAATALAAEGGYPAVVMVDVAARAGVSLGTVYRNFASKDHLLAEALREWGGLLGRRLREQPPRGGGAAERVAAVFRRMARGVEEQRTLAVALTTALLSRDAGSDDARTGLAGMMRDWIDLAIGDEPVAERDAVVEVLEHVCFSSMIGLVQGSRSPRDVGEQLARAARLLLGPPA